MLERITCLGSAGYLGGTLTVPEDFCWCWSQMREFNTEYLCQQGEVIHYHRAKFSLHAGARNFLAQERRGAWTFMTDTDHVFEPDILYKMLALMKQYQLPVLTGIYRHKALPHHPMLWVWSEAEQGLVPLIEVDQTAPCVKVDAAGGGCLLIDNRVFEQMRQQLPDAEPFDHIGRYGEDFSFFLRCRQLGIPVYATGQMQTTHLMLKGITDEDYVPEWYASEAIQMAKVG